jgi:hypothetical protein
MSIEPHWCLAITNPKSRERSSVPYDRHRASLSRIVTTKVPRVLLYRRGDGCDLRVKRHAAGWERKALAERRERVQVTKMPDPEQRCAERNMHAP